MCVALFYSEGHRDGGHPGKSSNGGRKGGAHDRGVDEARPYRTWQRGRGPGGVAQREEAFAAGIRHGEEQVIIIGGGKGVVILGKQERKVHRGTT